MVIYNKSTTHTWYRPSICLWVTICRYFTSSIPINRITNTAIAKENATCKFVNINKFANNVIGPITMNSALNIASNRAISLFFLDTFNASISSWTDE
jgi:hypothetical protein